MHTLVWSARTLRPSARVCAHWHTRCALRRPNGGDIELARWLVLDATTAFEAVRPYPCQGMPRRKAHTGALDCFVLEPVRYVQERSMKAKGLHPSMQPSTNTKYRTPVHLVFTHGRGVWLRRIVLIWDKGWVFTVQEFTFQVLGRFCRCSAYIVT